MLPCETGASLAYTCGMVREEGIHHGMILGIQAVNHTSKRSKQGTVHGTHSDAPFRSGLARGGWGAGVAATKAILKTSIRGLAGTLTKNRNCRNVAGRASSMSLGLQMKG